MKCFHIINMNDMGGQRMDIRKNILNKSVIIIDIALLISIGLLQYYSTRKMGMMRFLVYQNQKFQEGWFSQDLLDLYEYILVIVIPLCALKFFFDAIKANELKGCKASILAVIIGLVSYFALMFQKAHELKVYYFMLIALFIMVFLQLFLVAYEMVVKDNRK